MTSLRVCVPVAMVSLGAWLGPAMADVVAGPPGATSPLVEPVVKPAFAMLDNTGDSSQLKLDLNTTYLGGNGGSAQLLRPRLLAQYVNPIGVGAYVSAAALGATGDVNESRFFFGNVELGALYQRALSPAFDLGLRAGLVVHTGDDADDEIDLIALGLSRPSDLVTAAPGEWLRLGASPTVHSGPVFGRVDLGVDFQVASDQMNSNTKPIGHVGLGLGVGQGPWTATAEFSMVFPITSDDVGDPSSFKVAGVSARYDAGTVAPFLALSYPFDADGISTPFNVLAGVAVPVGI